MKSLLSKKVILWDFDGVIIDSNEVREFGFREVLKEFPDDQVDELLAFHNENGGLSRYVKFRYFFEKIRLVEITDEEVQRHAESFSMIMRKELIKKKYLIVETVNFLKNRGNEFKMHIVSGSDEKELNYLCELLEVSNFFISIKGSPIHKNKLVEQILETYSYPNAEVALIGDSINDYEAAVVNGIEFYGYNNSALMGKGYYIDSF